MDRIANRVALVTGAASGIGRAIAQQLARRGAIVAGADIGAEGLEETMRSCGSGHSSIVADLSSQHECEETVRSVLQRHSRIDILVNCAGIGMRKPAADLTAADVERVFAVNFFAPVYLTTAVLPGMLARRAGSIINVASVAGTLPNPKESAYNASKAALLMWTHGLDVDLRNSGVHVGALLPGPTDTGIWSTLDNPPRYRGKLFSPALVARAAVRMIDRHQTHVTAPRRYGVLARMYALFGGPMRWALGRYERGS